MEWDTSLRVALALHSNPGVYAILLGSGVSRTAGILTGWEIVLDLIRRLATMSGENLTDPPDVWYQERYGEEPDYAKLLDRLTGTPTERMQLVRSYFEPALNDETEELTLRQPTLTHRAVARLVQLGYVRIILTTNFDRLTEQALNDIGIVPDLISSEETLAAAPPYVHSRVVVVKLHGDYRDSRIRNTPDELASYTPPMESYLDRVLDEFGVLICGWSGIWDTALRDAILRCRSERFSTRAR